MLNCFTFVPENTKRCEVRGYLQESWKSAAIQSRPLPAIIICPGGAYSNVSDREHFPVAREFLAAGYHVFILTYSVKPNAINFEPLCQLAATVAHVRSHAQEWLVDPNRVAVCGFSAGGHLAASIGTLALTKEFRRIWQGSDNYLPDAMVLSYPVILANQFAHAGSIQNVSGAKIDSNTYRLFGLDQHVTKKTPPTFLWHTATDAAVPVENSLYFSAALSRENVPFELHVFPDGPHGMSTCTKEVGSYDPYNARWVGWSISWLNRLFDFEK